MRIGIDLGGTKIEGIALRNDGHELARLRVPTPRGGYEETIEAICSLVTKLEAKAGQTGTVGIGMPGALSPATGRIKNANSTWLNDMPFDTDIAAALKRPVRLANDADCFTLSESTDGAAAGAPSAFGVILGTGVGGGITFAARKAASKAGTRGQDLKRNICALNANTATRKRQIWVQPK